MRSAIFDFKAIAQASCQGAAFEITEGPGTNLGKRSGNRRRVLPYEQAKEPDFPAVMLYEPTTDKASWVECSELPTIQMARTKNRQAQKLIEDIAPLVPLSVETQGWAESLEKCLRERGIRCVATEEGSEFRVGAHVPIGGYVYPLDQFHCDWGSEHVDGSSGIEALARAIADKLQSATVMHAYDLWLPNAGDMQAVRLAYNNLRARVIRAILPCHAADGTIDVMTMIRLDVLFCGTAP